MSTQHTPESPALAVGDRFERPMAITSEAVRILKEQPAQTDWEAVAADQAMTIALLKAELQEFAEKQADSVEVALTESGWVWDGDQWQRPPQTWIELDHDDIHALLNEFFYKGMQPSGVHFANFARAIEAKLREKNAQPSKPLTRDQMFEAIRPLYNSDKAARLAVIHSIDAFQAIEAAHGIKEQTT